MSFNELKTKSRKNKHRVLGFISLIMSICLMFFAILTMYNLKQIDDLKEQRITNAKESEWKDVLSVLNENEDKANLNAGFLRDNIQQDILNAYTGKESQLKYDIDNPTSDSQLSQIFNKNLNDKYININNDNNDLFVINLHQPNAGILYDKSINCSKDNSGIRTWDIEKNMHSNQVLFEDAKTKISLQNTKLKSNELIGWEFLKSSNTNHYKMKQFTYDELEKVFLSEGISGLKTYEILQPQYIKADKTDILNKSDVSNLGEFNNNYKLAVVQGFNLYDEIMLKHKSTIQYYDDLIEKINKDCNYQKQILTIESISISAVLLVVIMTIISIQNILLKEEGELTENKETKEIE